MREVTLLGQNVNAWRGAIGGEPADFAELLRYVAEVDGIERIRYTTSHPREFTQRLIDAHAELPQLAPHVHLPVQSGADRDPRGDEARLHRARVPLDRAAPAQGAARREPVLGLHRRLSRRDRSGLRGHAAAGAELGFDDSFSFLYSPRPGTPAAELPDAVPQAEKHERLQRLQAQLEAQASARSAQRMVGSTQRMLVEGAVEEERRGAGRAHRQQPRGQLPRRRRLWRGSLPTCASPPRSRTRCAANWRDACLSAVEVRLDPRRQPAPRAPVRRAGRQPAADRVRARRLDRAPRRALHRSRRAAAGGARSASAGAFLRQGDATTSASTTCSSA